MSYNRDNKYSNEVRKYVDLKTDGRLFPTWVLANFKEYRIPEMIKSSNDDPCKRTSDGTNKLRAYQLFLAKFLDYRSPYHDMLIYHGLGSGKTISAINVYNMLYNYTPGWNAFILLKATLKDHPWMSELNKWLTQDDKAERMKNIIFISYDMSCHVVSCRNVRFDKYKNDGDRYT